MSETHSSQPIQRPLIARDVRDLIGNTPLLELCGAFPDTPARILAKLELLNPTSIKDRPVRAMIAAAMAEGRLSPEVELVEASSGNSAIALASLGARLGLKVRVYMSELCTVERQRLISAYGATVVLTPAAEHTRGARERALRYCTERPYTTLFLNQHGNPANSLAHEWTTGPEIWEQTEGRVDAIVFGLGTAGTFAGTARYLKRRNPNLHVVGYEPAGSPVYSGGSQGHHQIIGVGPGFIADNFTRDRAFLDELMLVEDNTAFAMARQIAMREGLLVGPSAGAGAWVARTIAERAEFRGKTVVCFFYDSGERYLSMAELFPTNTIVRDSSPL